MYMNWRTRREDVCPQFLLSFSLSLSDVLRTACQKSVVVDLDSLGVQYVLNDEDCCK